MKATPEQWNEAGSFASDTRACLLELRARVEALEGKYETMRLATLEWGKDVDMLKRWSDQHLQRIEALEADGPAVSNDREPASVAAQPTPASSLVKRVRIAIDNAPYDEDLRQWDEARSAIREVAAWLREQQDGDLVAATVLELEALPDG